MKRKLGLIVAILTLVVASASAQGTVVFNSIPNPVPGNVPSQGFQCCATAEIGDLIRLEDYTPRRAGYATVLMSSWALNSTYPTMPAIGYTHPITLSIYADEASARARNAIMTVTQNFTIPWRPEADPTCPGGTAWRHPSGACLNGYAFTIQFDLRAQNLTLPDEFIYGVAFNTNTWGYNPLGVGGPYESLNVGTANVGGVGVPPSVGADLFPDVVFWNTSHAGFYADGGTSGVGVFRPDAGWTGYGIAVSFSTFAVPQTASDCRNGAWANLVRLDFSSFKNQGDCVSYAVNGK